MIDRAGWGAGIKGLLALLRRQRQSAWQSRTQRARLILPDAACSPSWATKSLLAGSGGFYGYNISTGMTVTLDPFALENPNTVIIG